MEELRSTEILDREIYEDARKKAEKFLRAADVECGRLRDEADARIKAAELEKRAEYGARLAAYRQDAESTIPLDKQRRLVSFIDREVHVALREWFRMIGPDRRLELYRSKLQRCVPVLGARKLRIRETGYPPADIVSLVDAVAGKGRVEDIEELSETEARLAELSDGFIVETADRSILCRVTRSEIFDELLSRRRQELAESLFGGRLPE